MNISKFLLLVLLGVVSAAEAYKSHKIQIVVDPLNDSWNPQYSFWAINTASGALDYNFGAPRDLGSYYTLTGLIYRKHTVSKYQTDYAYDRDNNLLQVSDSIGSWLATDFVVTAYDLEANFPAAGTRLTEGTWSYFFADSEDQNNLYSVGRQKANVLEESTGNPLQYGLFCVNGGTGDYEHHSHRPDIASVKVYLSTAGNMLIKVRFNEKIEVHLD